MSIKLAIAMIVGVIVVGAGLCIGAILLLRPDPNMSQLEKQEMRKRKLATNYKWYKRFERNFLTRSEFSRLVVRIGSLSIYDPQELRIQAVSIYKEALLWFISVNLVGLIIFNDVFICLIVLTIAVVCKEVVMAKKIDKKHFEVIKALSYTLSRLRDLYAKNGNIPDALHECNPPEILVKPIGAISNILSAANSEKELEKFYEATPFRLLQTLASVCYILSDEGDEVDKVTGVSNFIQAMSMLSSEVNIEIRRITLQNNMFGVLEYLPLFTIPAIPLVENFFKGTIPGTSIIYQGSLGYVSKVLILLSALLGYKVISSINRAVVINVDDRSPFIIKALSYKPFDNFISDIVPKKAETLYKRQKKLKKCLSSKDLNHIYAEKVIYSFLAITMTLMVCYLSTTLGRDFIYENVNELSLVSSEELTHEDIALRKKIDANYLALPECPSKAETQKLVKSSMKLDNDFDIDNQVDRLMKKYKSYHNAYFHWYYILIAYGVGIVAWFIPEYMLKWRQKLIVAEEEEDVLQLQTNICILMNTSLDTLEVIYWLQRQSRVYRNVLLECYHNYTGNAEEAIERAKLQAGKNSEFIRMMDKLELTIEKISLKEAFSDLIPERDHILRIRESQQEIMIRKRRSTASILSLLSLRLLLILYVVTPIGIIGAQEFIKAMTSIG